MPDRKKIIEKGYPYDDSFWRPTTTEKREGSKLVRTALNELGFKTHIKITADFCDAPIPKGNNILILDMTKFDFLSNYNSVITDPQRYCLTFPARL